VSDLKGPLLAFNLSTTLATSGDDFTRSHVDLVGRFTVMAPF